MGDSEAGSVTLPPASPQQWLTRLRAHCGQDDFAATVADMWNQGVEMDSQFTLRRGVQICLTANHPELAIKLIKRARERRGVSPSAACVTSVLSALSKTEDLKCLLDFKHVMHECARFTPHIYGAFMDAFAALGAADHVRKIEQEASSDYPLTGKLLCSALRAWGVLQSKDDFDRHWNNLDKADFDGSHDVLTAAALGLSALHRWTALNDATSQWSTKWGPQPDWCSVLYLANLRAGDDEGANKALAIMNESGFVFDMDACGRFFEVHRGVEEVQTVIQRAKGETTESSTANTAEPALPEPTMLNLCRTAALALTRTHNEAAAREFVGWICRNAIVGSEAAQLLTAEFREDKSKESYTISPSTSSSSSPLASTAGRLSPFASPDPSPSVPTGLQRPARLQIPNPQPDMPQRRRSVAQTVTHVAITPPPQFGDTAAYALSPPASAALRRPLSAGVATEKPQVVPHPAEITISALIQSYGAEGRVKDVERCVHMLRVQGIEPTCATYNAVLGAYSQAQDWPRMAEWENEMREQGISPDLPTLQTLLVGFINAQMWQDAIRVQNEIIERGDMWGPEALQALLLLRHGNVKAEAPAPTNTNVITSADQDQLASALAAALTVSTVGGPPSAASHSNSGKDSIIETDVISPTTGPSSVMSPTAGLDSEIPTSSSSAATSRLLLWPVNTSTPPASTPSAGGTPKPSVQNSPVPETPTPANGVHSKTANASRRGFGQWPESAASLGTGSTPGISTASTTNSWAGSHEPFPSASASIWGNTSAGTAIPAFSPFPSTPSPAAGGPTPHSQYSPHVSPAHKGSRTPQPHPQATHLHVHTTHLHPHSPHGSHGGHTHGGHAPHSHNAHAPPHSHGSHLRPYNNAATPPPPPPPPTSQPPPPSHTHGRSGVPHAQTLSNLSTHYAQHNVNQGAHHAQSHSGQNSHMHGHSRDFGSSGGIPQSHTHPSHGLGLQAFLPMPAPSSGAGVYTDTISEYHNKIKSVLRRNTPSAWLEARQLWHELEFTHKMTPLEATYNVLLGGAPNEAAVTEVITGMQSAGVEWNRLLVGAALKALLRFGKLQRADQVVEHARTTGVALDVRVFNQMIDAYGKAQRLDDVQRYVHMLHELGLQPSVVTFGTLIKIYGSAGLIAEVDRCIAQMEALHIHPNSVAVTAMLTAFCKSGQLAKIEWALQLAGRDSIVIPERLWSTVLSAYIAQDMADRAFLVRQWCLWGQ